MNIKEYITRVNYLSYLIFRKFDIRLVYCYRYASSDIKHFFFWTTKQENKEFEERQVVNFSTSESYVMQQTLVNSLKYYHWHNYWYIRKIRYTFSFELSLFLIIIVVSLTCFTCWFLPSSLTVSLALSCFAITFPGTPAVFTALIQTIKSIVSIGTSC